MRRRLHNVAAASRLSTLRTPLRPAPPSLLRAAQPLLHTSSSPAMSAPRCGVLPTKSDHHTAEGYALAAPHDLATIMAAGGFP
ncbi:hypothetical protein BDA96_08G148000 [Sorghum bicolor]|uniref:Uncharacterized protein n=1 Tax=Sorghum bicolor TaxID=4558 RepID=A0A921QGE2_SORBI|nr:hypothetical protein BDA96_08G148000 [Sorghum bicolor]